MNQKLPELIFKGKVRPWKFTFENKYVVNKFYKRIHISKIPGKKPNLSKGTAPHKCILKLGVIYDRISKLYNFDKKTVSFEFFIYMNNVSLMHRLKVLRKHDVGMYIINSKVFYLHKTNIIICSASSVTEVMMAQAMLAHLYCHHFSFDLYDRYFPNLVGHLLKQYLRFNLTIKQRKKEIFNAVGKR